MHSPNSFIKGHGIDLVDLDRITRWIARDDEFINAWFTQSEIDDLRKRGIRPALVGGRVAAKEATVKSLGTGFAGDVSWQDVEVRATANGCPFIVLFGATLRLSESLSVSHFLTSISHTGSLAIASVIAIGEPKP